jgi:hypothetical protein
MSSHAGIYSWPSPLGEDSPSPERPHYLSEEHKQASDQGYQLDHLEESYGSLRHSNGKFLRLSTNSIIWA